MKQIIGWYTDKKGRRRPITRRRVRGTIFFPPKHRYAAERISLRNVKEAEASAEWLKEEFEKAKTRDKKARVKRFAVLAYNRAKVMAGNRRLSAEERREAERIAEIYRRTYEGMKLD